MKICVTSTPSTLSNWLSPSSYILLVWPWTMETVNVSQENHVQKQILILWKSSVLPLMNSGLKICFRLGKILNQKTYPHGSGERAKGASFPFQFCKKRKVLFESTYKTSFWNMSESNSPCTLKLLLVGLSFSAKVKVFSCFNFQKGLRRRALS